MLLSYLIRGACMAIEIPLGVREGGNDNNRGHRTDLEKNV